MDSDLTLYNKKNVQVGSYTHWVKSNPRQKKHVLIFDRDDNKVKYIKFGPARFPILLVDVPNDSIFEFRHEHWVWPHYANRLFCPLDRQWHEWGCECTRNDFALIPRSLRSWYIKNWI